MHRLVVLESFVLLGFTLSDCVEACFKVHISRIEHALPVVVSRAVASVVSMGLYIEECGIIIMMITIIKIFMRFS
jgi:hypothetical protein